MQDILIHEGNRFYKIPFDNIVYVVPNRKNYCSNASSVYMKDGKLLIIPFNISKLENVIREQLGEQDKLLYIKGIILINPAYVLSHTMS